MTLMRHLPAKGAYNIRDLGGYPTVSGGAVKWRRFLRSDSLHRLADGEADRLRAAGLRAVIDLRTRDEMAAAPNPFAAHPDVHFVNLPLFDDLSPDAMARIETPGDDRLFAFYITALETRGPAICTILREMARIEDGAVLFNCTAGKDRTGIIAALLLGLAEVAHDHIVADYALTADLIGELVDEFLDLSRQRGGDTESYAKLLESPPPTMAATLTRIEASHGSVASYMRSIGVSDADITRLHARLTRP